MEIVFVQIGECFGRLGDWIMQLVTMAYPFLVLPFMFFMLVLFIRLLSEDEKPAKKKGKGGT